jgi:ACS family hexuronate transporter-like MFS transporter
VGSLAGAWASSALIQRGLDIDRGRKCVLVPAALLGALGALAYFVAEPWLAVALVSTALFGQFAWAANMHTAISEVVPQRRVAVLYGITGAVGTLMGALTQPLIGLLVDRGGYALPFVMVGVAWVVALGLMMAAGRIEPLRRTAAGVVVAVEPAAVKAVSPVAG